MANPCSLRYWNGDRYVGGTAALAHYMSEQGGFDVWLESFSKKVAAQAIDEFNSDLQGFQLIS